MERIRTVEGIKKLLQERSIRIVKTDLSGACKALVKKQDNGYLILVEESLCFDCLITNIQHELCHILLGHLDDDIKTVGQKENEVSIFINGRTI